MASSRMNCTADLYDDTSAWASSDFYAAYRYLSHLFSWAGKSVPSTKVLKELDFKRMSRELRVIAKCLLREAPLAGAYIEPASLKLILSESPLNPPVKLREKLPYRRRIASYEQMGVLL